MTDKAPDLSPEAVERLTMRLQELDERTGSPAAYEGANILRALSDRVDALTKERDFAIKDRSEAIASEAAMHNLLRETVARLGAVERETLEKAATIVRRAGHSLADEIALLPLDPDAAAALDRAIAKAVKAEREACAAIVRENGMSSMAAEKAILARGAKQEGVA